MISPDNDSDLEREHDANHRRLARGVAINLIGIVAKISRPLYLILFSRLLGVEAFGLYMLAYALQEAVSKIAILGLNWGAKRVVGELRASNREGEIAAVMERILLLTLLFSALVALILGFSAHWIATAYFGQPELGSLIVIFCIGMPAMCGMYVIAYALRPSLDMRYELYIRSLIEPVTVLVVGLVLIEMGAGLQGVATAHVVASLLALVAALFFMYRIFPRQRGVKAEVDWNTLFHSSLGMGGMEFLSNLKLRLDLFVLAKFVPLSQVGVYSAIVEIGSTLRKMRAAFDPILMPLTQQSQLESRRDRLNEQIAIALSWSLQLGLGVFGVICLMPDTLIGLFGRDFVAEMAGTVLIIFSLGQFFHVTLGLLEGVLAITGHAYVTLVNMLVLIVLNLVLLLWLVPSYGLVGAAVATAVAYVVVTIWRVTQARRLLGIHPWRREHFNVILLFAGAFAIAWFAGSTVDGEWMDVARAVLFLAVYVPVLLLVRSRSDWLVPYDRV